MSEIFFFIRAYNDLDTQLPLIREFARDERFTVRVFFYPSDGSIMHPNAHEMIAPLRAEYPAVTFESLAASPETPFILRMLYTLQIAVRVQRANCIVTRILPLAFALRVVDVGINKLMKPMLAARDPAWLRRIASRWQPRALFIDEVLVQSGRSALADVIIPGLVSRGAVAYIIQTGHHIYKDMNPAGQGGAVAYKPSAARRYFAPGPHSASIIKANFPQENVTTAGNLRMDKDWLGYLARALPAPKSLPDRPVKVALMLSKMNYGVEADAMRETIRRLGAMENVGLAIKPHTRGMKFDFMPIADTGHAVIADTIPSAALIAWADLVLITGSSIVFHAMIGGKGCGFLQYAQRIPTLFDDGQSCLCFDTPQALFSHVAQGAQNSLGAGLEAFVTREVHAGTDGHTARHYKDIVLGDLGF